jgi:hypothetical protein
MNVVMRGAKSSEEQFVDPLGDDLLRADDEIESTVTKTTCNGRAETPRTVFACSSFANVVGQTSPQWEYPKYNTSG